MYVHTYISTLWCSKSVVNPLLPMDRDGLLRFCREGRANQSLNHGLPLVHTLALSNTTENHFFVQGLGRVCRLYVEVACHKVIGYWDFLFFIYIVVVVVVGGGGGGGDVLSGLEFGQHGKHFWKVLR